tara:strand:- start:826 stop:1131 length:306 start_codon:yes stop_codon:yes gene_type:complete
MPKRSITSPKRKSKMASKARISRGSKEAKEWNLKMQEAKRRKKMMREQSERKQKKTSPKKRGILKKGKNSKEKKSVRFSKKLEGPPHTFGTVGANTIAKKK